MRNKYDSHTLVTAGILQELQYLFSRIIVECARRLVTQQKLRFFGKRTSNRHTLLFAARQLRGKVIDTLGKPHAFKAGNSVFMVFADLRGKLYIFLCGEVRHKVIELKHKAYVISAVGRKPLFVKSTDTLAANGNIALIAAVHTAQDIENGSFSCTAAADNNGKFALFYFKRYAVNGGNDDFAHIIAFINIFKNNKFVHLYNLVKSTSGKNVLFKIFHIKAALLAAVYVCNFSAFGINAEIDLCKAKRQAFAYCLDIAFF